MFCVCHVCAKYLHIENNIKIYIKLFMQKKKNKEENITIIFGCLILQLSPNFSYFLPFIYYRCLSALFHFASDSSPSFVSFVSLFFFVLSFLPSFFFFSFAPPAGFIQAPSVSRPTAYTSLFCHLLSGCTIHQPEHSEKLRQ